MPHQIRLFTLEEANALIPELRPLMEEARRLNQRLKDAKAQLDDLRIIWGDEVEDPSCRDHGEFITRKADVQARHLQLHTHLKAVQDLGVEVKDADMGLLDFFALSGDRLVYLCWRLGEESIESWHPLQGGFAARKPIPAALRGRPEK